MRAKPVSADEQYRLIMECRSSDLTDYQWCLEHNIKPGTFYNWVKRLHQRDCGGISSFVGGRISGKQEVVKIGMKSVWKNIRHILQILKSIVWTGMKIRGGAGRA